MSRVRVLIHALAPESDADGVTEAYHSISAALSGTPGLLGNELMQSLGETRSFVVMSEWADLEAFRKWETGPDHRGTTSPLRPYQDASRGSAFGLYQVVANY